MICGVYHNGRLIEAFTKKEYARQTLRTTFGAMMDKVTEVCDDLWIVESSDSPDRGEWEIKSLVPLTGETHL